jgi:xylose isomerase
MGKHNVCLRKEAVDLVARSKSMPPAPVYRFCFGPWNLSEGADPYGPPTRSPQSFDWKLGQLKALGFDAMMFHDDDAIPDIDTKSEKGHP